LTSFPDDGVASAGHAWVQGQQALRDGDPAAARLWLARAAKLAPGDPRISFDLANVLLAAEDAAARDDAARIFTGICEKYDLAGAWVGLMTSCRLAGRHDAAARALGALLARHCLPAQEQFATVAALVAGAAGLPGWCGVDAAGVLRAAASAPLSFALDGKNVKLAPASGEFAVPAGQSLAVTAGGRPLLGSPLNLAALRRVEGIADAGPEGVFGWARRPAAPDLPPALVMIDSRGERRPVRFAGALPADEDSPFLPRHQFTIPAAALRQFTPPFRLCGPDGGPHEADIFGSPVDAAAAAIPPVNPARRGVPVRALPVRRRLTVVMPVYRGLAVTQACLESLFAAMPAETRVIVVDDATPEPALAAYLDGLAAARRITLRRQTQNLGFPAAANAGLQAAGRADVLLLNSDTLVPPGAIEMLIEVAYSRPDIGSVTPLSNQATILNYPDPTGDNAVPELGEAVLLNGFAARANGRMAVEIPTGIGFCMLLRHDCLAAVGGFRGDVFAQGYGEENDWCLRARQLGFTHMAAAGAFVAHVGGVSFQSAGRALNQRNATRLNRMYPGYHEMIMTVIEADPLAPARRRIDLARFAAGRRAGAVLLISHNHGGGVARRVEEEMAELRAAGKRPLLLFPAAPADPLVTPFPWASQLTDGGAKDYPNLRFDLPVAMPELLGLLRAEGVESVTMHHALGHHPVVRALAALLAVPQDIVIHDYASFCPRVNLLTRPEPGAPLRYCGEPNVAGCRICLAINGDETFEGLNISEVLARAAAEFAAARCITAPSPDAAMRIARHFPGVRPQVTPWEDDARPAAALTALRPPGAGRRKIAVIGGIGPAKGFDILIECAKDAAARGLALEFIVAGASADDAKLLETGRIFVTGAYQEREASALIALLGADLAFFPSIWPETWCFTLGEAWRAGLHAVAFDLGAQGARIRATHRGILLPLGLPASRINDVLLAWQPVSRNSHAAARVTF
jgi:GT2 family glycosyltransferase/glycosyltransferase involved in cell wall biosynthesis